MGKEAENHGSNEKRDWGENAQEMENSATREMIGALRKDKQMIEQDQKPMQPKDGAENGPRKEKIIDGTIQNMPS